mgnify:CR=1 FL=1
MSKKKKKAKIVLADEDYAQALDYSYNMSVAYTRMMEACEVIKQDPHLKKQYEKAVEEMFRLYQLIGSKSK